jgi:hypothetical protein
MIKARTLGLGLAVLVWGSNILGCHRGGDSTPSDCLILPTWRLPSRLATALDRFTLKTGREVKTGRSSIRRSIRGSLTMWTSSRRCHGVSITY